MFLYQFLKQKKKIKFYVSNEMLNKNKCAGHWSLQLIRSNLILIRGLENKFGNESCIESGTKLTHSLKLKAKTNAYFGARNEWKCISSASEIYVFKRD